MGLHFIPRVNIFDLNLPERNRGVPMTIHLVLHGLELLHLVCRELVAHKVKQSKLANAVQNRVHHFNVKRSAQKECQRHHLLADQRLCHGTLLLVHRFLELIYLFKIYFLFHLPLGPHQVII